MRLAPLAVLAVFTSGCWSLDLSGLDFAVGSDTATAELVADEDRTYTIEVLVQPDGAVDVPEAVFQLTGNTDGVGDATLRLSDGDGLLFEDSLDADDDVFTELTLPLDCGEDGCSATLELVATLDSGEPLTVDLGAIALAATELDDDRTVVTVVFSEP